MNFCLSISLYYCTELVTFHCFLWVYNIEKPSETKRRPVEEDSSSSDEKSWVRQRAKTQTLEKGFRLRKIRLLPMKSSAQQHAGALSLEQKGSDATNSPQFNSPQTAQTMTDRETARDKNQDKNKEERQRDKRQRNRDKET